MLLAISFAVISYFGWSIGDIFGTMATRRMGGYLTTFWMLLLRLALFSVYIPFALHELTRMTLPLLLLTIGLGLLLLTGVVAYMEALKASAVSLVGTISASFAALVVVLSVFFLGEQITAMQIIAISIIFLGVILCTLSHDDIKARKITFDKGVKLALLTMLCWSIYFTFIQIPVEQVGWFWPSFLSFSLFPVIYAVMKIRGFRFAVPSGQTVLPLVIFALFTGIADFCYNFAIGRGLTAVVAPISASYPTLFALLAYLLFKETLIRQQIVGIFTTLVGIVLLSFFSA